MVVDDCSKDGTIRAVNEYLPEMNERLHLIRHETNQGVGGAIAAGYKWCRDHEIDAAVVMTGDAQMKILLKHKDKIQEDKR
ncbi:MAG: glycosyltransferase [Chloroflexota bacterium]|nr:glycosyltransferase [Chloroflexota bacterium]